jgi:TIR domain
MSHVFISYVRENKDLVDKLASDLRHFGIEVWVDRERIKPGRRWKDAIREAIHDGAFFIACFSKEHYEKSRTYMNEELTLAIDELRLRRADMAWFIPVLLNASEIPERSIGAGETLQSLQFVRLCDDWDEGIEQIRSVIQPTSVVHSAKIGTTNRFHSCYIGCNRANAADFRRISLFFWLDLV